MGVSQLWQLLTEGGEGSEVQLSECSGESWAVDLSTWILHGCKAGGGAQRTGVTDTYMVRRTVFYRTLCLLKNGIRPVFVMDSPRTPDVKYQTLNNRCERSYGQSKRGGTMRVGLIENNQLCKTFLEALGLTVIMSTGEAEKTCALLNMKGIVDACLTNDSDIFLYGAKKVYRNFDMEKATVEKHMLSDIEDKLKLSRRDLVLIALIAGCDYGDGVKGKGRKKAMNLIAAIRKYSGDEDILTRVCGWRENRDLKNLAEKKQQLSKTKQSAHCSNCGHTGNKKGHEKDGCGICSSGQCDGDSDKPCPCDSHRLQLYAVELDFRQKALADLNFPDTQLVEEFLNNTETFDFADVSVAVPDWKSLASELQWPGEKLMKTMIPVLVLMHLHGTLPLSDATEPIRILRESQKDHVKCFLVQWKQFDFDRWTSTPSASIEMTPQAKKLATENPYFLHIPQDFMTPKYPDLVRQQKMQGGKKKGHTAIVSGRSDERPKEDGKQGTLEGVFTVKRKLDDEFRGEAQRNLPPK